MNHHQSKDGNVPRKKIHVLIINYSFEERFVDETELLDSYFVLKNWADSLSLAGAGVGVFQRFRRSRNLTHDNTRYWFVRDRFGPGLRFWQIPMGLHRKVRTEALRLSASGIPTVIHFNGLLFPVQAAALRMIFPGNIPMVFQHHAERPFEGIRGCVQRLLTGMGDMFFFTCTELAKPWVDKGMFPEKKVREIMEGTTAMRWLGRKQAREKTGFSGRPIVLWTGNLDENKDPLTVLDGFGKVLEKFPEARLFMAFRGEKLLPEVKKRIAHGKRTKNRVRLLGTVEHDRMNDLFNSADIFVQGSHGEGSGLSVLEALACGAIPVITDIASFRTLTGNGKIGALWPPGNSDAFLEAMIQIMKQPLFGLSLKCREFFKSNWSLPALGNPAVRLYGQALKDKEKSTCRR